ncbi:MAG: T9SS type A sorting domain-containing protein [Bacteroidia bacterium]|nr:T9SS type A sorting domain-containing protein [Bacteroidia bacterium]
MKHILSFLLAFAGSLTVFGQLSLDRQVLGTTGHWGQVGQYSLSYTAGETITTTLITTNGKLVLTQGFQQPDAKGTFVGIDEEVKLPVSYKIFPNPTSGVLQVEMSADKPAVVKIDIYDMRGRKTSVPLQRIQFSGTRTTIFNLEALADGIYMLNFRNDEGELIQSEKIQKIH